MRVLVGVHGVASEHVCIFKTKKSGKGSFQRARVHRSQHAVSTQHASATRHHTPQHFEFIRVLLCPFCLSPLSVCMRTQHTTRMHANR